MHNLHSPDNLEAGQGHSTRSAYLCSSWRMQPAPGELAELLLARRWPAAVALLFEPLPSAPPLQAEQQLELTKRLLAKHRADLEKAQVSCKAGPGCLALVAWPWLRWQRFPKCSEPVHAGKAARFGNPAAWTCSPLMPAALRRGLHSKA